MTARVRLSGEKARHSMRLRFPSPGLSDQMGLEVRAFQIISSALSIPPDVATYIPSGLMARPSMRVCTVTRNFGEAEARSHQIVSQTDCPWSQPQPEVTGMP